MATDSLLDNAILGKVLQPNRVFLCRDTEQNHRRYAQFSSRFSFSNCFNNGKLRNAWHGCDRRASIPVADKQRVYEITDVQFCFTHHRPQRLVLAQAARPPNQLAVFRNHI